MSRRPLLQTTLLVLALLSGVLLAPVLLPLLAAHSAPAQAQSVPWTPTVEPPTPTLTVEPPTATATALAVAQAPTATLAPTATPLPPGYRADTCEPNDSLVQPCALPTEVDIGDLTFVDDGIDVYSFLLKGQRIYTVRAQATSGIDPVLRVYLAGQTDSPLAQNDDARSGDASAEVQVQTPADGWYLAVVENAAPGSMQGRTYAMSARSAAAPTPVPGAASGGVPATTAAAAAGDSYENNYDLDHAGRLAWGVPYDLSLVCPDARLDACPAGDHDFFLVPVKRGVPLVAVTYDLGVGTDTELMIQRPDPAQTLQGPGVFPGWRPLAGNDDVLPGWTLRSQVEITPDWSGVVLLIVAPSSRANPPPMAEALGPAGRYRLMVGSPELAAVTQVLAAQTDVPPPAPTAAPAPTGAAADPSIAAPPAADTRQVIRESCTTGRASVRADGTPLYGAAPPVADDKLAEYPMDAAVRLLGECYGGWVKVQPLDSVSPGWMWGPLLQPAEIGGGELATAVPAGASLPAGTAPGDVPASGAPTAASGSAGDLPRGTPTLEALAPAALPPAPTSAPAARTLTVEVCARESSGGRACPRPLAGIAVEALLTATQAVQVTGVTDAQGLVTLSLSLPSQTAIQIRVAAAGVQIDVPADTSRLPIRVPLTRGGGAA